MATYEVLINVEQDESGRSLKYMRGWDGPTYLPGDALVRTHVGHIDIPHDGTTTYEDAAWQLVTRHNRDDRPDGQYGPSFGSGDVLVLHKRDGGLIAFASNGLDLTVVDVPVGYITDRTWRQVCDGLDEKVA